MRYMYSKEWLIIFKIVMTYTTFKQSLDYDPWFKRENFSLQNLIYKLICFDIFNINLFEKIIFIYIK